MKLLLEFDDKIFKISPEHFIECITRTDTQNIVDGFEFRFNTLDDTASTYVLKLASLIKSYGKYISFRGIDLDKDMDEHIRLLRLYNKVAILFETTISVTYDSCMTGAIDTSISKTTDKLNKILSYVKENAYRLKICMENLEYSNRPQMFEVLNISRKIPNLYIAYNIGHEIVNGYSTYSLPKEANEEDIIMLENVYIHDSLRGLGHFPFEYGNIDLYATFDYLSSIKYSGNVIIDIYFNFLSGDTFERQIKSYIAEANKVDYIMKR